MDTTNPIDKAHARDENARGVRDLVHWAANVDAPALPDATRRRSYLIL